MENLKNKSIRTVTGFGYGVILIDLITILWNWKKLPLEVPWFYSLPWGEEQLVSKTYFLVFAIAGLVLWTVFVKVIQKSKGGDQEVTTTILLGGLIAVLLMSISIFEVINIFTKWSF